MQSIFPNDQIDPKLKGYDFILAYSKAAWANSQAVTPVSSLFFARNKSEEIRMYALGKQSVEKYKKQLSGKDASDTSWLNVDWSPIPIIPKFREIAISKLMQRMYDITASAVDPLAKSQEDDYWAQMKAKIMMRQMALQQGSPLANSPQLMPNQGEPEDLEQLEMEMQFGYKHNLAMQAEEAIQLTLGNNKVERERKMVCEDLYDYGIAWYKEWIDENGMVKFKRVNPSNVGTSYCERPDFSDAVYVYEIESVLLADLVPYFTDAQMENIVKEAAGKYGNPPLTTLTGSLSKYYDKFHVQVMDLEFISYNSYVYKENVDGRGNTRFGKTEFKDINKIGSEQGEQDPKYLDSTSKDVYQTKWIMGTDCMYDWGISKNQKRKKSSWWDTSMSFHGVAWNFYKMQYTGITERLMPIADNYLLTWYKLQNLKNQLIPYLIYLDFDAVESVPFGKGGETMKPMEIIDLMFQKFVSIGRGSSIDGGRVNSKAIEIQSTGMLEAFTQLYNDLQMNYNLMQQISGFNAATDGSTINGKTLNGAVDSMVESTNSALFLLKDAERQLFVELCDAIIQKVQIAVKLGKVEGYVKALGTDSVKFLQINPDISLHEFGIFISDAPTDEERKELEQDLNIKDSQGLLDISDKILVKQCRNLKQAAMLLAYKIKKRREQMQQEQMQNQQMQQQGAAQAQAQADQAKMQFLQMENEMKLAQINAQGQWQLAVANAKTNGKTTDTQIASEAKTLTAQIQAEAKKEAQRMIEQSKLHQHATASADTMAGLKVENESKGE